MRWRLGLCIGILAVACGGLDPIVAPDASFDATIDDAAPSADAPSRDVSSSDATPDEGAPDASVDAPAEAEAGSPFACGAKICDAKTHYCEKKGAGDAGPGDAGAKSDASNEIDTCVALPPNCLDDGGMASCTCIGGVCACNQSGDAITVTCP